jgi:hypothetical protein
MYVATSKLRLAYPENYRDMWEDTASVEGALQELRVVEQGLVGLEPLQVSGKAAAVA